MYNNNNTNNNLSTKTTKDTIHIDYSKKSHLNILSLLITPFKRSTVGPPASLPHLKLLLMRMSVRYQFRIPIGNKNTIDFRFTISLESFPKCRDHLCEPNDIQRIKNNVPNNQSPNQSWMDPSFLSVHQSIQESIRRIPSINDPNSKE